jgi:hypothetical protein
MMKALFGGDGMPDPPDTATVEESPHERVMASLSSEENLSANEGDMNMGTTNVVMQSNTNGKRLPWSPNTELPSVQEGNDNEKTKK